MNKIDSLKQLSNNISKKIHKKVEEDRKDPTGNQNCLLCTWCSEAQFRGIDILPRPVYSPRDIIFKYTNAEIVKYHRKMYFKNIDELTKKILKGERYYCHINWKNSKGGHEFLLLNINNEIYIMDSQGGLVEGLKYNNYFNNINFNNSFIVRLDNKILNNDILKFNDNKYILEFNEKTDLKYLK